MRMAADFLMALQLTGAAKKTSMANLQMRLPAVVIGGGLTGIDAATEAQAYYITQVEKLLERYETLTSTMGRNEVRKKLDVASLEILPAADIAKKAGEVRAMNLVMVGALAATGRLPLEQSSYEKALQGLFQGRTLETNWNAFQQGYQALAT